MTSSPVLLMMPDLIAIARHESAQLRRYPPRLWPLVHEETRAARLLLQAHGRRVQCAPLNLDLRVRMT